MKTKSQYLCVLGSILVLSTVGSIQSALYARSAKALECDEFQSILGFVDQQHLRLQQRPTSDKGPFLSEAFRLMPKTLTSMGYPLLAAQFDKQISPKIEKSFRRNPERVCKLMGSALFRAAFLKSYVRNLDPYSDFYLTEELSVKASALEGEFIGVGIATEHTDNGLIVNEVLEDGPAAGKLKAGDVVLKIDHRSVLGLSEVEVRNAIRGADGSLVVMEGKRGTGSFEVKIKRGKVHQRSVHVGWLDDKVLTIRITRFIRQTSQELEAALHANVGKAKGLILDLRDNPGGLLQSARDVVDLFISQGVVVYLKGRDFQDQVWAVREGAMTDLPLVVLVNENTASAAEIVAGALQDYGRAAVVGQKTYGKGSVQNIYETQLALGTDYRAGLKITTLWYFLPSGKNVQALEPDVRLVAAQASKEQPHRVMPYHGPEKIDVASLIPQVPLQSIDKKRLDTIRAQGEGKATEEVGKAVLLEMLAGLVKGRVQ